MPRDEPEYQLVSSLVMLPISKTLRQSITNIFSNQKMQYITEYETRGPLLQRHLAHTHLPNSKPKYFLHPSHPAVLDLNMNPIPTSKDEKY
jgi:hypothetical protein